MTRQKKKAAPTIKVFVPAKGEDFLPMRSVNFASTVNKMFTAVLPPKRGKRPRPPRDSDLYAVYEVVRLERELPANHTEKIKAAVAGDFGKTVRVLERLLAKHRNEAEQYIDAYLAALKAASKI